MNRTMLLLSFAISALAICVPAAAGDPRAAEDLVQVQLNAYNARDIDAFLATYGDDIEVYDFPEKLRFKGKPAMRTFYTGRFVDQTLHATVAKRIVMDNTVIDQEHVRLMLPGGPGTLNAVAIYDVRDGKIAKVTFIMGARVLDSAAAKPAQ